MGTEKETTDKGRVKLLDTFYRAVADDLEMLALLHDKEPDAELLEALRDSDFPAGFGLKLVGESGLRALETMRHAVRALPDPLTGRLIDELAADYADIYLNHTLHASPLESVWIDEEQLTCQESMFQVRSWYEHFGLSAEDWRLRPDDHLVLQLQFLSMLFAQAENETSLEQAARFMDDHLLRWLDAFAQRVAHRCATAYFAGVALLTAAYCEELRDLMAMILGQSRPSAEEIDERMTQKRRSEEVSLSYMPGLGPAV